MTKSRAVAGNPVDRTARGTLRRRAHLGMELEVGEAGLIVAAVQQGGPADQAGVEGADRLLSLNGARLTRLDQVRRNVAGLAHGHPCDLEIERAGGRLRVQPVPVALSIEQLPTGCIELDEVRWRSHRLRAIWSFPPGGAPCPLVWLLPGAAWLSDEHATEPEHSIARLVAQLTAAGFATLRVERSGLGDSEGPLCTELDLQQELEGFGAAFLCIRQHARIRQDRVFLFGRSLGGMIAPLLAAEQGMAGLAVWGSTARPWHDAMLRASLRQLTLAGRGANDLARFSARLEALQSLVYLQGLSPAQAFARRPDLRGVLPTVYRGRYVYGRVASYFQQLQRCDLEGAWSALRAPVLALHGSCDWMSELDDAQTIAALCGERGHWQQCPGLDHLMHQRPSLAQAFAAPWEGAYAPSLGRALIDFFDACDASPRPA